MRTSLLAKATMTTFWCARASRCASQMLRPGACLCRSCSTLRAPERTRFVITYCLFYCYPSNFCSADGVLSGTFPSRPPDFVLFEKRSHYPPQRQEFFRALTVSVLFERLRG